MFLSLYEKIGTSMIAAIRRAEELSDDVAVVIERDL
jgi:hypothetical protein